MIEPTLKTKILGEMLVPPEAQAATEMMVWRHQQSLINLSKLLAALELAFTAVTVRLRCLFVFSASLANED